MAQPTVTLFVRIPPDLSKLLEKHAEETGDSKNKIVTEALEKYLQGGKTMTNETLNEIMANPYDSLVGSQSIKEFLSFVGSDTSLAAFCTDYVRNQFANDSTWRTEFGIPSDDQCEELGEALADDILSRTED